MEQTTRTKRLVILSAVMTVLAGVIHLILVPAHMKHAPAHGLFFLLAGTAQIIWGLMIVRQPSLKLYYIGAIMAGWLIILYGITRLLPAPFSHGPEAIETIDLVCKFCEALGMFSLLVLIFQGLVLNTDRFNAWRTVTVILLISFLIGFVTYGVARAAEPLLPRLTRPVEEHRHDGIDPSQEEEHHHDESFLTFLA